MASTDNDIQASTPFTVTGAVKDNASNNLGSVRVVGIYYVASVAGSVTLSDNNGTRLAFPVAASASGMVNVPQNGIWFRGSVTATVTGATLSGCTVFYTG